MKASFWFLIATFLQKGLAAITTPIFSRIMSTADYGKFGVFQSWHGIIAIIIGLSLPAGVHVQGLIKFNQERKVFSSSLQGLSVTMIAAWFLVYILFHSFWNSLFELTTIQMICMFVIIWSTAAFSFWANEQRVTYSYKPLVAITVTAAVFSSVLEIVLVTYFNDKATARIIGCALANLLCYGWCFFRQQKKGRVFYSKSFWTYALGFNLPLIPHYLSQVVLNSADRIMIERMVGDSEAGIYTLAYSLAVLGTMFTAALLQTLNPWIYQKIKDRDVAGIAPVAYATMILVALINLLLILLAPEILRIFAPAPYYDAVWIIPPVAMSGFFMYCYDLFAKFAFYYEKTKAIMVSSILSAALNIVLNTIFIGRVGYLAAGYTTLACYLVYAAAHYLLMRRMCRVYCNSVYPYNTKLILMIAALFGGLGALTICMYDLPAARYSMVCMSIAAAVVFRRRIIDMLKSVMEIQMGRESSLKGASS